MSVKKPKISIVIPMYNAEKTIKKTLDSIYKNPFKDFEVIVINDGGTDNSVEITKKYPVKIFHQRNLGVSEARNVGVKNSNSDLILFVDSDVVLPPYTLEKVYETFKNNKINVLQGIPDIGVHYRNKISDYENLYLHYHFSKQNDTLNSFYTGFVVIRKSLFEKFEGFNKKIRILEDGEFGQRLLNAGNVIHLDKSLKFLHLRNFSLYEYMHRQIIKASVFLIIKLRSITEATMPKKSHDVSFLYQLGIPLSLLIPISLIFSFILPSLIPLCFLIFVFITLILINIKMLIFMAKKRGFMFFISSYFIILLNYWCYFIGLCYGSIIFLIGERY
tara:strand:+ start:187 stop:1182 length:996 start_codon:yes stop_codon:yes gene_type:complete